MMRKGKCTNIGNCNLADSDKIIQIPEVDDFECPECGIELNPFSKDGMWPISRRSMRRLMGAIALLVLLFLGYRLFTPSKTDCNKDEFICCQIGDAYETLSECDCLALNDSIKTVVLASENTPCENLVCLERCYDFPIDSICGSDGKKYRNIQCLECIDGVTAIECISNKAEELETFDEVMTRIETAAAVNKFYLYIEDIANAKTAERSEELKEMALDMFISDQVTVEISNSGGRTTVLPIMEYLDRAAKKYKENYDNIKVDINKFEFDKFIKNTNSEYPEYTGKVAYNQAFIGYSLGEIKYGDSTGKGAEIIVKAERESLTGKLVWKVYLSHIFVIEDARLTI